jgi:hypothetical protein
MEYLFDETFHMYCPKYGFEVLYLDQDEQCVYYVFHNGNIDLESECFESDEITDEEHGAIRCNSSKCNWVK